jgi:hypothetical protein
MRTAITPEKWDRFIENFIECCNITKASKATGIDPKSVYNKKKADPEFAERLAAAEIEVQDKIEAEIWRRGVEGTEKPVMFQGKVVGVVKEYSDRMLELLAKGHMPHRYADKLKQEITGANGAPLMDNIEVARRIAFILRKSQKKDVPDAPEAAEDARLH